MRLLAKQKGETVTLPTGSATALNRFGLGARFDLTEAQRKTMAADPRGFLKDEMKPERALLSGPYLETTRINLLTSFAEQERKRMERDQNLKANTPAMGMAPGTAMPEPPAQNAMQSAMQNPMQNPAQGDQKNRPIQREVLLSEAQARWQKAFEDPSGFIERLVWFWSNHFAVSVAKGQQVQVSAGSYEREAIRPFVLGQFGDMLKAVEKHPTMLFFLDNRSSMGPDSKAGKNQKKGLNENLAREILELHTLGVDGGYTQADVTNFARIITGWTWYPNNPNFETASFVFNPNAHQPGEPKVLSKIYAQPGIAQGEAVLDDLVHSPATAKHLATKFVRHFVADEPPPALVAKLAKVFGDTGGNLLAFTHALLDDDLAWAAPATKLRTPQEYLAASARALNLPTDKPEVAMRALNDLGQPLWKPSGPNGYGDRVQDWGSAEGMKMRFAYAVAMSNQAAVPGNPTDLANIVLADAASPETRQAIARAETRQQGLSLLLMSPEFQRR